MICKNCGQPRDKHVGAQYLCIGQKSTFQLKINNLMATFLYVNDKGVAESRDATLYHGGRQLARLDNVLHELLTLGNTNISVNVECK